MQIDAAIIKEQGVTFTVVVVKPAVLQQSDERESTRQIFSRHFPGVPIILMAQNSRGVPTYHGRTDIVNFLAKVHFSRLPWKKYNLT